MSVCVVTDSTADLPRDEAAASGITVVPLNVLFGSTSLLDGIEISPQEFFQRLPGEKTLPKTSQPAAGSFLETYQRLLAEGASGIVSVHISGKLSGTINSARTARDSLDDPSRVVVVDSGSVSAALAYGARAAAAAAAAGGRLEQVAQAAQDAMARTHLFVTLETLEYLQKGGRIGRARAWFGGVLSIKPVLAIVDGEIVPLERVRTHSRAISRVIELAAAQSHVSDVTLLHSAPDADVEAVRTRLAEAMPQARLRVGWLGAVVGVYAGPNAIGIVTHGSVEASA